jgi:transmembrane sensor
MEVEDIRLLFHRYLGQTATPEEERQLMEILVDPGYEAVAREAIETLWDQWEEKQLLTGQQSDNLYARIREAVNPGPGVVHVNKAAVLRRWQRMAAAAAAVILVTGSICWLLFRTSPMPHPAGSDRTLSENDVMPGSNKAVLTLGNGVSITLDSTANGLLAQQGNATIFKTNSGQLAYNTSGQEPTNIVYNTLTTPRGGGFQLVLPDGSKVWLNAASSVHYPSAFKGNNRQVDITGEAYFEIAKDADRPFIVRVSSTAGAQELVKVLGTQFNINAYDDEPVVRTTLLEGAVRVEKGTATATLKPGQQASLTDAGKLYVTDNVNVEEAVAWKNGRFYFNSTPLPDVLRQVARWYDVDVKYQEAVSRAVTFSGEIGKDLNLSEVLDGLNDLGVRFKIEGKKLIVMP